MNGYLLDTHIWFWWAIDSPRLSTKAKGILLNEAESGWVSSISIREMGILSSKGRLELGMDLRKWVERALSNFPFRVAPVDREISLRSTEIELATKDPADHIILATAEVLDLHLITADQALLEQKYVKALF